MKLKQWFTLILSILVVFSTVSVQAETTSAAAGAPSSSGAPEIAAQSAILMDAKTKTILFEKNAYETHYPASITKLMTALLAIENLSPDQTITFSKDAIFGIEPGSSHIGIQVDEQLTVDQALHGLLLMSANEVANGLAEAVSGSISAFADRMTDRAKELGTQNTHFANPHGLHDPNHYTTAYDMALIGSYLAENDYFLSLMKDTTYNIPPTNLSNETRYLYQQHHMLNPVRNPKTYREDVIGGKTGYTDQARHTLVTMAKQGDTTLVAVILQSEKQTLYTDTASLLDYGFASYQSLTLHTTDDILKALPCYAVKSGQSYQSANYGLAVAEDAQTVVLNSVQPEDIQLSFDVPESVDPTYQVGDPVGTVSFTLNGQTLCKSDLIVKQIDPLPEPDFHFYASAFHSPLILCLIGIIIFIVLCFIIFIIRKKLIERKYSKIGKYFK